MFIGRGARGGFPDVRLSSCTGTWRPASQKELGQDHHMFLCRPLGARGNRRHICFFLDEVLTQMAIPSTGLIRALRQTAARIRSGSRFQWTHMGACNCGHLAQTVTALEPARIHSFAIEKEGEWADQAFDHCPTSGYRMDDIISALMELGLSSADIANLERLNDRTVLRRMPPGMREADYRDREHAVTYMEVWADVLEERMSKHDAEVARQRGELGPDETAGAGRSASDAIAMATHVGSEGSLKARDRKAA